MLSTRQLTVGYDDRIVLDELDVELPADAFTVIVGPNACGKSTLLRTMARLLKPLRGSVLLDGAIIGDLPTREVAQRLAVLPQSPLVPEGITVADLVGRGRQPYQRWWQQWSARDAAAVREAMTLADVQALAERPVDTLSGGQRSRASLACAIVGRPELIVLDEPTVGQDPVLRADLWAKFHAMAADGTTLLVSSHVMDEAGRCDRLLLIRDGRLIADDTPDAVRTAAGTDDLDEAFLRLVQAQETDPTHEEVRR